VYLNRWVLLLSCVAGVIGLVMLTGAFMEYRDSVRAYSRVEVTYDPGSVVWDTSNRQMELTLRIAIINRSSATVTAEYLDLRLYTNGVFAGADYDDWQPIAIPALFSEERTVSLEVSNPALQDQIAQGQFRQSTLTIRGEVRLRFAGIERPLTQRVSLALGGGE
jgi:hypothetical protein